VSALPSCTAGLCVLYAASCVSIWRHGLTAHASVHNLP
jgi:hypothetical protein